MKIGIRTPSLKKRIAARTSVKRMVRAKVRAPRGMGWLTNPKKAAYNRVYRRTTVGCVTLPLALLVLLVLALLVTACGATATPTVSRAVFPSLAPTLVRTPTYTHTPTPTSTLRAPTATMPAATATPIPPTPTLPPATMTPVPLATTTPVPTHALATATTVPTSVPAAATSAPSASACPQGCAVATPPAGCDIKGNVNSDKEKIYHVPGMRDYNRTQIKPAEGDRWFCSEADARAAGFRRAQQ